MSVRRALALLGLVLIALTAAGGALAATVLPGFHSPSGNIRCLYVPPGRDDTSHRLPSGLLCSIGVADYAAQLGARCMAPGGAGLDWHGWSLTASGKGAISCSGGILYNPDTQRPRYANLAYGHSWRRGAFTCRSRVTGISCSSRHGHGLFISRETWHAW